MDSVYYDIFNRIADELARANRLKRVELWINHNNWTAVINSAYNGTEYDPTKLGEVNNNAE